MPPLVVSCAGEGTSHDGGTEGFEVFKMDWPRVEAPYAVGLWILVVAFIKIGKKSCRYYITCVELLYIQCLVRFPQSHVDQQVPARVECPHHLRSLHRTVLLLRGAGGQDPRHPHPQHLLPLPAAAHHRRGGLLHAQQASASKSSIRSKSEGS